MKKGLILIATLALCLIWAASPEARLGQSGGQFPFSQPPGTVRQAPGETPPVQRGRDYQEPARRQRPAASHRAPAKAAGPLHGNYKSMRYHHPDCRFYNCKTCIRTFNSAAQARDAGYSPCGLCDDSQD